MVFVTSWWMGWGNLLTTPLIWMSFLLIYVLVWVYQLIVLRHQAQRINQALEERQSGSQTEAKQANQKKD